MLRKDCCLCSVFAWDFRLWARNSRHLSFPAFWLHLGTHRCTVLLPKAPPRSPLPDSSAFETSLQPIPSPVPPSLPGQDCRCQHILGSWRRASCPSHPNPLLASDPPATRSRLFLTPTFLPTLCAPLGCCSKLTPGPVTPHFHPSFQVCLASPSLCSTDAAGLWLHGGSEAPAPADPAPASPPKHRQQLDE